MSDKRLKEIRDSIELQLELCKQLKVNDEMILEEKELSDEVDRLNNIINELEEAIKKENDCYDIVGVSARLLNKLKELKENNNGK